MATTGAEYQVRSVLWQMYVASAVTKNDIEVALTAASDPFKIYAARDLKKGELILGNRPKL